MLLKDCWYKYSCLVFDVSSPSVDYSAGLDGGAATDIALAWPCLFQGKKAPFWTCHFLGLRLSFHLWQMRMLSDYYNYIHLRLSWVRRSSAEVWEKGWSKSIQSDGEQNRIWKWPTKRSQANHAQSTRSFKDCSLTWTGRTYIPGWRVEWWS